MKKSTLFFSFLIAAMVSSAQVPQLNLVQITTGYVSPLDIKHCGDNRIFIVEQRGRIYILYKDGSKQTTPFMILDSVNAGGNEQGLLGLAFSPNFKQDGYFYLNYTFGSSAGSTRISRFSVFASDSTQADPTTEKVLLTFTQPYSNHNGGNMMFGPDGYLYISTGDGGSANDPGNRAQNKDSYLGKTLRIDVTGQTTYAVPPTNPFVGQANTKPEVWSYGLRNHWRCSFDKLTGDMWIGDVGQDAWEEIDFQPASSVGGENYGWKCREGAHPVNNCTVSGYTDPVYEVPHGGTNNCSITGGYVYRGTQYASLFGQYLFSDFCSGRIWAIKNLGNNVFDADSPTVFVGGTQTFLTNNISTFGEDNLGELYVAGRVNGRVYRITERSNCNPVAFVTLQDSLTGCRPLTLSAWQGDTLSYQWYNSAGIINGGNTNEFSPTQSGWYKVKVSKRLGCETMSDSVFVRLFDSTALVRNSVDTMVCISEPTFVITNYITPVGGSFVGNGVVGSSFSPSVAGLGTSTISYTFSNIAGCESRANFNLEVGPATALTRNVPGTPYCNTDAPFSLVGFVTPSGGVYSGGAVSGSIFNPGTADFGDNTVYYSYTNTYNCQSTDSFVLSVLNCVGIAEMAENISFSIFPNPNKGNFNLVIETASAQQVELTMTDVLGKVCLQKKLQTELERTVIPIQLSQLPAGVYSMQLKTANGLSVKSLIIE